MNPKSMHASRNAEDAFLKVEPNVLRLKAFERDIEVINHFANLLGFDHDVIDVSPYGWPDVFPKNVLHSSLVHSPCVP
jgi:hypothetical protein